MVASDDTYPHHATLHPAQITDYVDADLHFAQPLVPWKMRFSSDWDKVSRLNQDQSSDEVYTYWPESCLYRVDHDMVTRLNDDFMGWDLCRDGLHPHIMQWSAACSRLFSVFPELPVDQLSFAHRHYMTAFYMDDSMERSCRNGTSTTFGSAFVSNLRSIYSDPLLFLIDLNAFESDLVPRSQIDAALFAQEVTRCTTEFGKKVLSHSHFAYHRHVSLLWLEYLLREAAAYQENIRTGGTSSYSDLLETRHMTIGFEMTTAGILPPDDTVVNRILTPFNPFYHLGSIIVVIDNDTASAPKEMGTESDETSPSNFFIIQKKEGKGDLEAVRHLLEKRNAMAKCMDDQLTMLPASWRPAYFNILKCAFSFCDFEYVLEHGRPNTRYGFMWYKTK